MWLVLVDFIEKEDSSSLSEGSFSFFYSKLKEKMSKKFRDQRPFSMNFELVETIGVDGQQQNSHDGFACPWDVKFSCECNCIMVSDFDNHRIQVFDAITKEYKTTLIFHSEIYYPQCLCIEKDYDGIGGEALLLGHVNADAVRVLSKFDLKNILTNSIQQQQAATHELWSSRYCSPDGIAVWRKTELLKDRIVVVCDYKRHAIYLFESSTGEFIQELAIDYPLFKIEHPSAICISMDGLMFISFHTLRDNILILRYSYEKEKWIVLKDLSNVNNYCKGPNGLYFDNASRRLLVCFSDSQTVQVFSEDGTFCKMFKLPQEDLPILSGICVCEWTGELCVCDCGNHRLQIYK